MQKWPGSDQGTCLSWAQRTQSELPNDLRHHLRRRARRLQRGSAPRNRGPSCASCALQNSEGARGVGWNPPPGNLPLGGEEGNGIGVGLSPGLSGPAIPAPAAGPHLARESCGWRREGRTPGVGEGDRARSYNFLWPESWRAAPRAYAVPVEWVPSGIARVWGTREETRLRRGLRGGPTPGRRHCGTTFGRRRVRDRGERGPPGTPHLGSRIPHLEPRAPRPASRAPRLACVPSRLHLARASKTLELESEVPQSGGFSSPR